MSDTLRQHRVGIVAWVVGGAVAMFFMGLSLAQEMQDFPGGAQALAAMVTPGAEALRPLRWPAERLDTLGGYMTYHNIVLFQGFLALYAAIQGARAIRGDEEHLELEQVLATGWSRTAVVRDRALGFLLVTLIIWIVLAVGVAGSLLAAGEPNTAASFISTGAMALCMLVAYGLGLLVSQFVRTPRAAAGISSIILVVLYIGTNVWEDLGPLGVIRFVSPFYWANQSRALVPGYGADIPSLIGLALAAILLVALASWAFAHRDYGGVVWQGHRAKADRSRRVTVAHWWLRDWWIAHLVQHGWGLLAWAAATAAFVGVMMGLQPAVMDAWQAFDFYAEIMGGAGSASAELMYTSFAFDIVAPVVVAYVITQASGWVADLDTGRVEQLLAAPMSATRLVLERMLAALTGVLAITAASITVVVVSSLLLGSSVDAAGIGRVAVLCLLLGAAITGLALLVVAALRSGAAVTALAVYAGAAYLLTWLIPIFHWPDWLYRLSVFDAFGHPYQEWPGSAGLVVLVVMAIAGTIAAAMVSERMPKVATG